MFNKKPLLLFTIFLVCAFAHSVPTTQAQSQICAIEDRACILQKLEKTAQRIDNQSWQDQTYRELAKTLAFDGRTDEAVALIANIHNPDTKAMTIRGIGMAIAAQNLEKTKQGAIFAQLHEQAGKIEHEASFAIALTYIAMAQAFAGDNEGSWKTAKAMENTALRNKAYGETAEIQAERGEFTNAMTSISHIDSTSFQNKAYALVAKILADKGFLSEALQAADKITNAYKQAGAVQYILDAQKPRDIEKE